MQRGPWSRRPPHSPSLTAGLKRPTLGGLRPPSALPPLWSKLLLPGGHIPCHLSRLPETDSLELVFLASWDETSCSFFLKSDKGEPGPSSEVSKHVIGTAEVPEKPAPTMGWMLKDSLMGKAR